MRVLIVDDFEDMRDLLEFLFAAELGFTARLAQSGQEAISILEHDPHFDLIVSDMNMPNGTGQDVFNYHRKKDLHVPFILMSGDSREKHPQLHSSTLHWLKKPFDASELITTVKDVISGADGVLDSYVPVSFALLERMQNIEFPLFIRINDHKFVKVTSGPSVFEKIDLEKYQVRGLKYLYIESMFADDFIAAYRKKVLSIEAWQSATPDDAELVSINTELMQNLSARLGWGLPLVELAKQALNKALLLAKNHPSLNHVFNQFHKIERYGFSDHCTLTLLVSCGLLKNMGYDDEVSLAKMTFASVLHDMSLSDELYQQKTKLIKRMQKGEKRNRDMQAIFEHPARAAEICRNWSFCPPDVESIIMNHHEKPDGQGFPLNHRALDLDFMCSMFILSEDFTDFFIEFYGKPNLTNYLDSRRALFSHGHFGGIFRALEQSIELQTAKAS